MNAITFREKFQNHEYLGISLSLSQLKNPHFMEAIKIIKHLGVIVDSEKEASALQHLPSLEALHVHHYKKDGHVFENMKQLRILDLDLDINNLSLGSLSHLQTLNIRSSKLTNIEFLSLPNLRSLMLAVHIENISSVAELRQLRELDISDNIKLKSIDVLKNLLQLRILSLSGLRISNFDALKELHELTILNLSNTAITHTQALVPLDKLQTLDLSKNYALSDWKGLKNLQLVLPGFSLHLTL